jgi:asparagine synthase (glutamine-hydrolysing)
MFAIALVDTHAGLLHLARDPFGIKPLYWRRMRDGPVVFASEPRPLASIAPRPDPSPDAIAQYLSLGALESSRSPFDEIMAVPPNSVVTFDGNGRLEGEAVIVEGFPLEDRGVEGDPLRRSLRESVSVHLRSDVPTALLLSAGTDSSAIAVCAHDLGQRLGCLTVAGLGPDDESKEAASTAAALGHEHQTVDAHLEPTDVAQFFSSMQRPTIDGLNGFVVCRAVARAGFKVALSGLGGDEMVGGYSHFRYLRALSALARIDRLPRSLGGAPRAALSRFVGRRHGEKAARLVAEGGPRSAWALDLLQREVIPRAWLFQLVPGAVPPLPEAPPALASQRSASSLMAAELVLYLQATLLPDADAFSMCSSVELRVPFVDRQVLASGLHASHGTSSTGKGGLAAAIGDPLLVDIARRPKRGFTLPMAHLMGAGGLQESLREIESDKAPLWQILDRTAGRRFLSEASPVDQRWAERWSLVALNSWLGSVRGAATVTV